MISISNPFPTVLKIFFLTFVPLLLGACSTTRTLRQIEVRHDTLHIAEHDTLRQTLYTHDSIYHHDSIYMQGPVMVKERTIARWHTRHDTVYIASHLKARRAQLSSVDRRSTRRSAALSPFRLYFLAIPFGVALLMALFMPPFPLARLYAWSKRLKKNHRS